MYETIPDDVGMEYIGVKVCKYMGWSRHEYMSTPLDVIEHVKARMYREQKRLEESKTNPL